MLRLVADVNFNGDILSGLRSREPRLDVVRAQDCGLDEATDPELLEWASGEGRVVLSHDRSTLPPFAYDRIRSGLSLNGVFIVDDWMPIGAAIDELHVLACCSDPDEWIDLVHHIS